MITLKWTSEDNATYSINYSADLKSFLQNQEDNYQSGGETTTYSFANPAPGEPRLYFRVTKNPAPNQ